MATINGLVDLLSIVPGSAGVIPPMRFRTLQVYNKVKNCNIYLSLSIFERLLPKSIKKGLFLQVIDKNRRWYTWREIFKKTVVKYFWTLAVAVRNSSKFDVIGTLCTQQDPVFSRCRQRYSRLPDSDLSDITVFAYLNIAFLLIKDVTFIFLIFFFIYLCLK